MEHSDSSQENSDNISLDRLIERGDEIKEDNEEGEEENEVQTKITTEPKLEVAAKKTFRNAKYMKSPAKKRKKNHKKKSKAKKKKTQIKYCNVHVRGEKKLLDYIREKNGWKEVKDPYKADYVHFSLQRIFESTDIFGFKMV
jgi:hypothetical protein